MKQIKAPEPLMKIIEEIESKKSYNTMNVNMTSKIIGYSRHGPPGYFIRADYFKDRNLDKEPQEHWSIPNPYDPYFVDCRSRMHNMKELMEIQDKLGVKSSTEFYYKQIKKRYDFLMEPRRINPTEYIERTSNDWIQFITRN